MSKLTTFITLLMLTSSIESYSVDVDVSRDWKLETFSLNKCKDSVEFSKMRTIYQTSQEVNISREDWEECERIHGEAVKRQTALEEEKRARDQEQRERKRIEAHAEMWIRECESSREYEDEFDKNYRIKSHGGDFTCEELYYQ